MDKKSRQIMFSSASSEWTINKGNNMEIWDRYWTQEDLEHVPGMSEMLDVEGELVSRVLDKWQRILGDGEEEEGVYKMITASEDMLNSFLGMPTIITPLCGLKQTSYFAVHVAPPPEPKLLVMVGSLPALPVKVGFIRANVLAYAVKDKITHAEAVTRFLDMIKTIAT